MHEVYRENYLYNGAIYEIIIFRDDENYKIKSFHNRQLNDKIKIKVTQIRLRTDTTEPQLVFQELTSMAKKNIERLHQTNNPS